MARPGGVIANGLGVQFAKKYAARMANLAQPTPWVTHGQTQMFAGERVGHLHGFGEIARFDNATLLRQGFFDNRPPRQALDLFGNRVVDRFGQGVLGRDQQRACQWIVLRLRQQVRRNPGRIGRIIGDDQALGRSRQRLDAHLAKHHTLGQHHEQIAWPDDLVDPRDARGAVRQAADGLGAPTR